MPTFLFFIASIAFVGSIYALSLTMRLWNCPDAIYEENRRKALRGERLTEADIDRALARYS